MPADQPSDRKPMAWIPTLYFAQGIPFVVVMMVAVVFYKRMGMANSDIAWYTSWLYLPWVIKPIWSPLVDLYRTKRFWIVITQLLIGGGLAGIALTTQLPTYFQYTLAFFWLLAFASATHDIAADGFYMLALSSNRQAFFVGIRSTFYRFAMITGQGLLVMLAGMLEVGTGLEPVGIQVNSKKVATTTFSVPSTPTPGEGAGSQPLGILASTTNLSIAIEGPEAGELDDCLERLKELNLRGGYTAKGKKAKNESEAGKSWFCRVVSEPLGEFLRQNFNLDEKRETSDGVSNLGVVALALSRSPVEGERVVVNIARETGDKAIRIALGSCLVFTEANWRGPAYAVMRLDDRLRKEVTARFEARAGNVPLAWSITFFVLTGLFFCFFLYHRLILPRPAADGAVSGSTTTNPFTGFLEVFISFFRKKRILMIMAFLLLYRLAEAQLVKMASPFLLDLRTEGGLGLTTGEVGFVYGTVGMLSLTAGGILGGLAASRGGLRYWLMWMAVAINIPNAVYIILSYSRPESYLIINLCVAVEQFGYGFGFTAYMLFMIYVSRGTHRTAHFAITTGFMALGMMLPGMMSGWLQEHIGYRSFFIWIMIATIPAFLIVALTKVDPAFGREKKPT